MNGRRCREWAIKLKAIGSILRLLLALFLCPHTSALAQEATDEVAAATQTLTGGTSRTWIATSVLVTLGPGGECAQGETFTFSASGHSVVDKRCETGPDNKRTWVAHRCSWSIEKESPPRLTMTMCETRYQLRFENVANPKRLRLTNRQGPSKIDLSSDLELHLSED